MTHGTPVAIVLRCPHCGSELPGLDADRGWACRPCGHAWEVEGDALAPRPFRVWRVASEARLHLPFWRVEHRAEVSGDHAAACDAVRAAAAGGRSWVRAFSLRSAFLVGDPGQVLTAASNVECVEDGPLPAVVGIRIGAAEAVRLAELFVLAQADVEADVTPVTLSLDVLEVALVAVPYAEDDLDLVSLVDGGRFRKAALPDAAALLAR